MDFHLYKIRIDDDFLEMEIDYTWNIFGMSYSEMCIRDRLSAFGRECYSCFFVQPLSLLSGGKGALCLLQYGRRLYVGIRDLRSF